MLSRLFKRKSKTAPVFGRQSFADAKAQHDAHLSNVNAALRQSGAGPLIALPLCAAACEGGAISNFLLQIGANPFDRWNMMYFASDASTAQLLDTVQYSPELDSQYDQAVTDVIGRVAIAWDSFHDRFPNSDPQTTADFAAQLCDLLDGMARDLEPRIYLGRTNKWTAFFDQEATAA